MTTLTELRRKAARIVRDSGGKLVGRTRLQKVGYLLELAGLGEGFAFEYRHYGPYSEELADAIRFADAFGEVNEEERLAEWGGHYSVYTWQGNTNEQSSDSTLRKAFATRAAQINAIELELLATAAYLSREEDVTDPWAETARRKPNKATADRIAAAKMAYEELRHFSVPKPLPVIN